MCLYRQFLLVVSLGFSLLAQPSDPLAPGKLAPEREVHLARDPYAITVGSPSPKGTFLSAHFSGSTWIWDGQAGACLKTWQDRQSAVGFTRDEHWLVVWDPSGAWLEVWDWVARKQVRRLGPFPVIPKASDWEQPYRFILGEGDADLWVMRDQGAGPLRGWNLSDGRNLGELAPGRITGDPLFFDGRLILFSRDRLSVSVWVPGPGHKVREVRLLPPDLPKSRDDVQRTPNDLSIGSPRIQEGRLTAEVRWTTYQTEGPIESAWRFDLPVRGGEASWTSLPSPAPLSAVRPASERLGIRMDFSSGVLFLERGNDFRARLILEAEVWQPSCLLPLPTGGTLLQRGSDGSLRIWNLKEGRLLSTLGLPPELKVRQQIPGPYRLMLLEDGRRVLAYGIHGPKDLFDLKQGRFLARLGNGGNLDEGAARVDNHQMLVSTSDGLALWDLHTQTVRHAWERATKGTVSPDGAFLAFVHFSQGSQEKPDLQVWDLRHLTLLGRIQLVGLVTHCRFTEDSRSLSVVSVAQNPDPAEGARDLFFHPASGPGVLHLSRWSLEASLQQVENLKRVAGEVTAQWTPKGFVLEASRRAQAHPENSLEVPPPEQPSSDGRFLLKVLPSGICLQDRRTGLSWDLGPRWSGEERYLFLGTRIVGMNLSRLRYWNLGDLEAKWPFRRVNLDAPAAAMAFSPDGSHLAVLEGTGIVRVVEVPSGKTVRMLGEVQPGTEITGSRADRWVPAPGGGVRSLPALQRGHLAFSPDGSLLAATTGRNQITVFETASGAPHDVHVVPAQVSPARMQLENSGRVLLGVFRGDPRKEALCWTTEDLQGNALLRVACPRWANGWDISPSEGWDRVAQLPTSAQGGMEIERFRFAVCESKGPIAEMDGAGFSRGAPHAVAAWSPIGDRLAFLMADGRLAVWRYGQTRLDSIWLGKPLNALAWLPGQDERLLVGADDAFQVMDLRSATVVAASGPIPTRPASLQQGFERLWIASPRGDACAVTWVGSTEFTLVLVPALP